MTENYPGPWQVRINYSTVVSSVVKTHQHRFNLDMAVEGVPGDPFSEFKPQGKLTAFTETLADYVDDYVAVIQPFFNTTTDLIDAELWEYEPDTNNAAFRSVYTLGLNGTSGSASVEDGQAIVTIRSTLGGTAKFDFRRSIYSPGIFQTFPTSITPVNTFATFCTGNNTPLLARDNGYLFSPYKFLPGTNEASFKDRLR